MAESPDAFYVLRLNGRSDKAWAVIDRGTDAIARSPAGDLIFRLTQGEATSIAKSMSDAARAAGRPPDPDRG